MGVHMQVRGIVLGACALSVLAGCSFERQQVDYKAGAVQVKPLEVPPDLTTPETDTRYVVPGADGEKAANYSEYSKKKPEQPCVNPAPVAAPAVTAAAAAQPLSRLAENKGVKRIEMDEPFDRSWRRVGLALEQARVAQTDKDRSKGIYFVSIPVGKDKKATDYQVIVRETKKGCEVVAVTAAGKNTPDGSSLVELLYRNLPEAPAQSVMPPADGQFFGDAVRPLR